MFGNSPNGHLDGRDDEEDVCTDDLALDGENEPAEALPEVVGAGDHVEAPALGDSALS